MFKSSSATTLTTAWHGMLCVFCFMKQYFLRSLKINQMQKLLAGCGRLFLEFSLNYLKKE